MGRTCPDLAPWMLKNGMPSSGSQPPSHHITPSPSCSAMGEGGWSHKRTNPAQQRVWKGEGKREGEKQ